MLMMPLTIKQQKFSRLSSKMNPELTKIQNKYKGKKDPQSQQKMQAEMQELYQRYGTNPLGGCLPLLITLPIMFALYQVIYRIPAYVTSLKTLYLTVAEKVSGVENFSARLNDFLTQNYIVTTGVKFVEGEPFTEPNLVDIFSKFTRANWDALLAAPDFSGAYNLAADAINKITSSQAFFGMNVIETPGFRLTPALVIPILAMALYFVQNKLMMSNMNQQQSGDNPMAKSMKTMNNVMPIVSGMFCVSMPIGVGIYWIAGSVFQIGQQLVLNHYMDKIDIDEMIAQNVEKADKRKEKLGVKVNKAQAPGQAVSLGKVGSAAMISTKKYNTNNVQEDSEDSENDVAQTPPQSGSISMYANLLKNRNEK
jgi:YidC/Oxa1 family membrane protein insertase